MEPLIVAARIWALATSLVYFFIKYTRHGAAVVGPGYCTGIPLTYELPHAQRPLTRNIREHND